MTSEGENNIKTANGNDEEYEDDPDFIQETQDLEEDLALEAQDSFDEQNGGYPAYLYDQEQRSGGKIKNTSVCTRLCFSELKAILIYLNNNNKIHIL